MQKYIVTVSVNGAESPINLRAVGELQAIKQVRTGYAVDKILRIETREEYKKRTNKFNPVMTSSFSKVKSSKHHPVGN